MQTNNIQLIPIDRISFVSNYRDSKVLTTADKDITELAASIDKDGVMQSILLRPDPGKKDHYQVIFGHRRVLASRMANKTHIPAAIKVVADDEILELQVVENLQRRDVHPIEEAIAFKQLIDKKKYIVSEIAGRFAKSDEYVTQRLKLNDLLPELQKEFKLDKMLLGHALLLCRLTPDDQKKAKKWAEKQNFSNESVSALREWIQKEIEHDLSKVKWDIHDKTLFPQAGACSACPKRSGAGNLLFTDMAKDNRCFDSKCFDVKAEKSFIIQLKEVIETKPDVHIVYSGKISNAVNNLLQKMKIKSLKEYSDFMDNSYHSGFQVKAQGFYVSENYEKGKLDTIYLKGKSSKKAADTAGSDKENNTTIIAGIKERTKRAAELDAEKVHARIIEAMKEHPSQKQVDAKLKDLPEAETVAMLFILFKNCDYSIEKDIVKKLNLKGTTTSADPLKNSQAFYSSLRELSTGDIAYLVRKIMLRNYPGTTHHSNRGFILRKIAEGFKDIPISEYEKEQKEIRDKREKKAEERISALQPKKRDKEFQEVWKKKGNTKKPSADKTSVKKK